MTWAVTGEADAVVPLYDPDTVL